MIPNSCDVFIPLINLPSYKTSKSESSFNYLFNRKVDQGVSIAMGSAMEQSITQITEKLSKLENIKEKNKKGVKEKDILFKDPVTNTVWYFESKTNLNLDTEKAPATSKKIKEIKLENDYKGGLLALRWLSRDDIPKAIRNKFKDLDYDEIYGMNDYLNVVGVEQKFIDYDDYKCFVNTILDKIYPKNSL